ncbi:MAG: hypothetical protein ACLSBH_16825 [Coprobacillus cateniformis]
MKQFGKKFFAVIASMAMVIGLFSQVGSVYAAMPEYEIYPKPHKITYENSDFILREKSMLYMKMILIHIQSHV